MLIYDSIELERDRNASHLRLFQSMRLSLERHWIRKADGCATVSAEIARQLARDYEISPPIEIHNVPPQTSVSAGLRDFIGLDETTPLAVYVGTARTDRGLVPTIMAVGAIPDMHLAVVGSNTNAFHDNFKKWIVASGIGDRIHAIQPRPPSEAAAFVADADVAVAIVEPICASYVFALPNKLFQAMSASLPVVVGRTSAMRRIVNHYDVGESVDERDIAAVGDAIKRQAARRRDPSFLSARAALLAKLGPPTSIAAWARLYAGAAHRDANHKRCINL
jgi:glycosyltransferase involved in cell wall biosynthesis